MYGFKGHYTSLYTSFTTFTYFRYRQFNHISNPDQHGHSITIFTCIVILKELDVVLRFYNILSQYVVCYYILLHCFVLGVGIPET